MSSHGSDGSNCCDSGSNSPPRQQTVTVGGDTADAGDQQPCLSAADKNALRMQKLRQLHSRRYEARKLNQAEVVEEDRRNKLPKNWEQREARRLWMLEDAEKRKQCEEQGIDYDRVKALDTQADMAEKIAKAKKRKKNPDTGFAGFEDMTVRQHERLSKNIKPDMVDYAKQKAETGVDFYATTSTLLANAHYPSTEGIDRMVKDLEQQDEKRGKFHRRRAFDPDADVDFINERNRRFNEKVNRFYGPYTDEVKQALERGTAV